MKIGLPQEPNIQLDHSHGPILTVLQTNQGIYVIQIPYSCTVCCLLRATAKRNHQATNLTTEIVPLSSIPEYQAPSLASTG